MQEGLGINAQIEALKLPKEQEIMVGTALVDMYAKCGFLTKAMRVFDSLADRDVVAWNALVVGYTEHGHDEEVLKALKQMQLEGISPDSITLFSGLRSCLRIGTIAKGQAIQAEIERNGFLERGGLGNAMVDLYVKHGLLNEAKQVFDKLQVRDVVVWNMLISGYVEQRQEEKALECFKEMQLQGVHPSAITYACCLKACGILGAIDEGREIFACTG
jgi:pentatricopeptide repeat protein